jgi:membrane protein implicated in regulation of membrane protease activity
MPQWELWFLCAGIVVIFELFTGTFYLLMVALGLAAGGGMAFIGKAIEWQYITAAFVAICAICILRKSKIGRMRRPNAVSDPNINLDIGQTITVDHWTAAHSSKFLARVKYRGTFWDVELAQGGTPHPGLYVIREIHGSRLVVSHHNSNNS